MAGVDKKGREDSEQHEKKNAQLGEGTGLFSQLYRPPLFSSKAVFILEIFLKVVLFIFKVYHAIFKAYKDDKEKHNT